VAFDSHGQVLVSCGKDGTIRRWDLANQTEIGNPFTGYSHRVHSIAFRPGNDPLVATGFSTGTIVLWRMIEGQAQVAESMDLGAEIKSIAYSPNQRFLALGLQNNSISFHDLLDAQCWMLNNHQGSITSIQFSANSQRMASASFDGTILLWDLTSHRQICAAFGGHDGTVWGIALNSDGKTLASCGNDRRVILRSIASRDSPVEILTGHKRSVRTITFSHDGKTLASGSTDRRVILWDIATKLAQWNLSTRAAY
jgi:WD40 repeat protein